MNNENQSGDLRQRHAPIALDGDEFRRLGHQLVDQIAEFLDSLAQRRVTPGEDPATVRAALGAGPVPEQGGDPRALLAEASKLLMEHSLFNGHPRFMGYITSSAAPLGALADLLAAAVNPNCGGWVLAPMASEIEGQTIRWIAEMIGYPAGAGGLLVSGGNMANFVGFLAGRRAKAAWPLRAEGLRDRPQLTVYAQKETHTWIQKAADLFGLGTNAIRWIAVDEQRRMHLDALEQQIAADRRAGLQPIMVIGAAGSVAVGAVDPLPQLAQLCQREGLWFHVDGAYGAPAAMLPEAGEDLKGLALADSIALDPHKWLYSPLEAGCTLVKNPQALVDTFSFTPDYYHFHEGFDEQPINYFEFGLQNSRGFRALKVWLAIRQVGRAGYTQMIRDDIALARALFELMKAHPDFEAVTNNLSITTFRYVPADRRSGSIADEAYLNELNRAILNELEAGGDMFVSNAIIEEKFLLRACIVNFRTSLADIDAVPELVARVGRTIDTRLRAEQAKALRD